MTANHNNNNNINTNNQQMIYNHFLSSSSCNHSIQSDNSSAGTIGNQDHVVSVLYKHDLNFSIKIIISYKPTDLLQSNIVIDYVQDDFLHVFGYPKDIFLTDTFKFPLTKLFQEASSRQVLSDIYQSLLNNITYEGYVNTSRSDATIIPNIYITVVPIQSNGPIQSDSIVAIMSFQSGLSVGNAQHITTNNLYQS